MSDIHRLTPLFAPRSVLVVGASNRPDRPGFQVVDALLRFDPELAVHPVTPKYDEIIGRACFPDVASAPTADLAIIASGGDRIEAELAQVLERGVRAVLVLGAPAPGPERPAWVRRLAAAAAAADVPLLGPDTLGFVNHAQGVGGTWAVPDSIAAGGISIISQSGTTFWEAITCDPRLRFSFSGHTGLEATLTMSDLLDYSLSLESTRVVGLYAETVRDPDGLAAALEVAVDRQVPVVAMYSGRTQQARAQLMTHAGRMAGDRSALEGLFRKFGVAQVESPDEWWTTLALLGSDRRVGPGGLAAVMDSGGGLAMFMDLTDEFGVEVADVAGGTRDALRELLGFDGDVGGAVDFWVGDRDRHGATQELLDVLAADPSTAAVMAFTTYAESPTAGFAGNVADACRAARTLTHKPVAACTYTSRQLYPDLMRSLASDGVPVLDGMRSAVQAFGHAFAYRDFLARRDPAPAAGLDPVTVEAWRTRLDGLARLDEADALALLSDFGVVTARTERAADQGSAVAAADRIGYPVVLKTDEGLAHKANLGGVELGLRDAGEVRQAYSRLSAALGPRVVVAAMASGVEVAIGVVAGEFGPTVLVGAGGVMIEVLDDRAALLSPVCPAEVAEAMKRLRVTRLLRKELGAGAPAEAQLHETVALVSTIAHVFRDRIVELDVNPVLVGSRGAVAVDALVGLNRSEHAEGSGR